MPRLSAADPALLRRFNEEQQLLMIARVQALARLGLIVIVLAALVITLVLPDRLPARLAIMGGQCIFLFAVFRASRRPGAVPHARQLAGVFAFGLATSLFFSLSLSPNLPTLLSLVTSLMACTTIAFPWGGLTQTFLSLYIATGFSVLLSSEFHGSRTENPVAM